MRGSRSVSELRDQLAHGAAAAVALAPAALWPNPLSFAWAGLCLGLTREVTEWQVQIQAGLVFRAGRRRNTLWSSITSRGSLIDLACWMLGGLMTGCLT